MPGGAHHSSAEAGRADESRIANAIQKVVHASGMDLESVRVTAAGRRRLLRVVVDSDHGVSLDDAAALSRELSLVLDDTGVMGDYPYTLEVSSPGVDRARQHFAYSRLGPGAIQIEFGRLPEQPEQEARDGH